ATVFRSNAGLGKPSIDIGLFHPIVHHLAVELIDVLIDILVVVRSATVARRWNDSYHSVISSIQRSLETEISRVLFARGCPLQDVVLALICSVEIQPCHRKGRTYS